MNSNQKQLNRGTADEFSVQLRELIEVRDRYFINVKNVIKQLHLAKSNKESKFAIKFLSDLKNISGISKTLLKWTNVLLEQAFEKYREGDLSVPRDLSDSIIDSVDSIERSSKFKALRKPGEEIGKKFGAEVL